MFDWFGELGYVNLGAGTKALYEALAEPEAQAFDFLNGVDPLIVIRTCLVKAADQLRSAFGPDPDGWRLSVDTMAFSAISFFGMSQASPDESFVLTPAMNRGTINYMVALGEVDPKHGTTFSEIKEIRGRPSSWLQADSSGYREGR